MTSEQPLSGVPALVLGAGFGTRLRPLTDYVPKPTIPVLGRPLIGHPLIQLYAAGCWDVHVNAFHQAARMQATLDAWVQRRLLRMTLRWSVEGPDILGTGGALRRIEPQIAGKGPILLLNGDAIVGADLPALWAEHQRHDAVATLLCVAHPDAHRYNNLRVTPDGRVIDTPGGGRPPGVTDEDVAQARATVFCGIHVIEPSVLATLPPDGTESCIIRQGYAPLLRAGATVRAVVVGPELFFHDVGTPERYLNAQEALLRAPEFLPVGQGFDRKEAVFQEASYAIDADGREYGNPDVVEGLASATLEAPVFFGPRNVLEPGCTIGPHASLGALNRVGAGAAVRDSALWSQVEVAAGERVEGSIVARLGGDRRLLSGRPDRKRDSARF